MTALIFGKLESCIYAKVSSMHNNKINSQPNKSKKLAWLFSFYR